jgi:hypothetical protein
MHNVKAISIGGVLIGLFPAIVHIIMMNIYGMDRFYKVIILTAVRRCFYTYANLAGEGG